MTVRWLTAGESHGPRLTGVLEGLPAGIPLSTSDLRERLTLRRQGYGRGARMEWETDVLEIVGGVRHGYTTGAPVAVQIENAEWDQWRMAMSADPVSPQDLTVAGGDRPSARNAALTRPRPGHADLAGMLKYGHRDARDVLERASARETATRTALGTVAAAFLTALGIDLVSHTIGIAAVDVPAGTRPDPRDRARIDHSAVRCIHPDTEAAMIAAIDAAREEGETVGGRVEALAYGVPPGLGTSHQWDRRLDGRLAAAALSIPAIKAVEIGDGWHSSRVPGSQAHDVMVSADQGGVSRETFRHGGLEGGMTTGEILVVRAAMKPIPTLPRGLATVDLLTGQAVPAHPQRSDSCAVPAAGVVLEAMMALVLAEAVVDKFGGDHLDDTRAALSAYLDRLPEHLRPRPHSQEQP